jgi:hypothetical protein
MTDECYLRGMAILEAVFEGFKPGKKALSIFRTLLNDLDDDRFSEGVMRVAKEVENFYPGTNMVALIRNRSRSENLLPLPWENGNGNRHYLAKSFRERGRD